LPAVDFVVCVPSAAFLASAHQRVHAARTDKRSMQRDSM
jgi:hypothetical protein